MRFLHLLWRNLTRKKLRTAFTFLSVVFAFVLYGVLAAFDNALTGDLDIAGANRLRMTHKLTVAQALPVRYMARIAATEGVTGVTHASWFGGVYQDARNFFPQYAVDPESFLDVYDEYRLPEEERRRWLAVRTGAIAGRALADRFGWKVGDRIPLRSSIYGREDGSEHWEFTLEGIYSGARPGVDEGQLFFHHAYLEEGSPWARGEVRWFVIRIASAGQAAEVAERLDRQFANSSYETKTSTEQAFLQSAANQIGDTGAILASVVGVTFFVILLVVGNTVAQAVRERAVELAVLKALGFTDRLVLCLVLAESLLICGLAGGLGLALAWIVVHGGSPAGAILGAFYLSATDLGRGIGLVAALAFASGILPAFGAMRLQVAAALGRV